MTHENDLEKSCKSEVLQLPTLYSEVFTRLVNAFSETFGTNYS